MKHYSTNIYALLLLLMVYINASLTPDNPNKLTLQLVHVIHRHGARNPDPQTFYPTSRFVNDSFAPSGKGKLTLLGKKQMFNLGKYLRERFDDYLGQLYYSDIYEAWCTNYRRTEVSLMYVLTGLFSKSHQEWNESLVADNFSHNVNHMKKDTLLGYSWSVSPEFLTLYRQVLNSEEVKYFIQSNNNLFLYVNKNAGLNLRSLLELSGLYQHLKIEQQVKQYIPNWAKSIFPFTLQYLTVYDYYLQTYNRNMLKYAGGPLIRKILSDSLAKINGTLSDKIKIIIYSGHDINIVTALKVLGVYYPHTPPYGSNIIIELHLIDNVYGFKIFYDDFTVSVPRSFEIPHCGIFCPIDTFIQINADILY